MVTGEPPSTLDGGQCKVTMALEAEVNVKLDGGAGGTPLLRLTVKEKKRDLIVVGCCITQTENFTKNLVCSQHCKLS